jgi:hypothetical protein
MTRGSRKTDRYSREAIGRVTRVLSGPLSLLCPFFSVFSREKFIPVELLTVDLLAGASTPDCGSTGHPLVHHAPYV